MKIAKQVITYDQALQLVALGVSGSGCYLSYFGDPTHFPDGSDKPHIWLSTTKPVNSLDEDSREDLQATKPIAPAFTVAELGLAIGGNIRYDLGYNKNKFTVWELGVIYRDSFATEAQARAYILINLLTDKILTPEQVNERLKG